MDEQELSLRFPHAEKYSPEFDFCILGGHADRVFQ
jgi:hypothetical protein